ncbi:monooxygenase 3-like [Primulina eburnea]|uniref:monooxygenase 3-like n=1 Tax=Primulina eburnea TaxID=1245227 RepID=UPI003C6BF4E0
MQETDREICEDIVIVGAGISGLATALALHWLGIRSLVLESFEKLRITGFLHVSADKSQFMSEQSPFQPNKTDAKFNLESRCVMKRKDLLETMEREWPQGTNRYSSKVVPVEEGGPGSLMWSDLGRSLPVQALSARVLIGCDGGNSLGLHYPVYSGRSIKTTLVVLVAPSISLEAGLSQG